MKKISISVLIVMIMFSMTSYAGEWKEDNQGYWYENDDGSYVTGWYQDIDGKWYYMDNQTGYMIVNTTTPDGYAVDENGVWIEGGEKTITENRSAYDNIEEFKVTSYQNHSKMIKLNYTLPVTVFYNNEYENENGKISIEDVSVTKDGLLCYKQNLDRYGVYYELNVTHAYTLSDETVRTYNIGTGSVGEGPDVGTSGALLWDIGYLDDIPSSVEIFIDFGKIG